MAQGASTPIEVRVAGKNMAEIETYATTLVAKLREIDFLRDVQIAQPLTYADVFKSMSTEAVWP